MDTHSVFHDAEEYPECLETRPPDLTETRLPKQIKEDGDVSSSEESKEAQDKAAAAESPGEGCKHDVKEWRQRCCRGR
eukprot:4164061-Amphidinium_carterae.1